MSIYEYEMEGCDDDEMVGMTRFALKFGLSLVEEPGSDVMEPFTLGIRQDRKPLLNTFLGVDYKQELHRALDHVRGGNYWLWTMCWDGYVTVPEIGRTDAIYVKASRGGSGVEMTWAWPYRRTAEGTAEPVGGPLLLDTWTAEWPPVILKPR